MSRAFGPFTLIRSLGSGSHAEVFLAEYRSRDEWHPRAPGGRFAVKRLFREVAGRDDVRARFFHEAELASKISHRHLVGAFDHGEVDGLPYAAMEWVRGTSLASERDTGPLELAAVQKMAEELGAALDHLHRCGWVHCDVSPGNVLIDSGRGAVLADLGLATESGATQAMPLGTTGYMAPEQVRGEPLDGRADVFALAVVLWEALSGRRLFKRGALHLTMMASVEDPMPELGGELAAIDEVLQRGAAKKADERTASCAELVLALLAAT